MREKIKNIISTPTTSLDQQQVKAIDMVIKLHKQEDEIFQKTIQMQGEFGIKVNILDRELYDFQMLVELLKRFGPKEKTDILGEAQHELILSYRFMLTGHYNSAGKHLRSFMEHTIDYLCNKPSDKRNIKIEKLIQQSTYKQDQFLKLNHQQVYIFYAYLSNIYTHHSDPFEELKLKKNKLHEIRYLIIAVILVCSRLIFGIHGELIESHYKKKILYPVSYEKGVYGSYIQQLLSTSRFYNTMMEGGFRKKVKDNKGNSIDITLRVDEKYYENTKDLFI